MALLRKETGKVSWFSRFKLWLYEGFNRFGQAAKLDRLDRLLTNDNIVTSVKEGDKKELFLFEYKNYKNSGSPNYLIKYRYLNRDLYIDFVDLLRTKNINLYLSYPTVESRCLDQTWDKLDKRFDENDELKEEFVKDLIVWLDKYPVKNNIKGIKKEDPLYPINLKAYLRRKGEEV
ncbi:MAG: hypothetical protein CL489_10500 [Acidobacteria bacterium]|nr:hypothetical protein [Acidobacteriota bacterium]